MSVYTTQVRYICEEAAGLKKSKGYNYVEDIIRVAIPEVMPDFPIFDENYRQVLCTKILKHYYTREIGLETVGLWKLKLDTKLNEIMPYYNKLYRTELIEYNPLYEVDLKREYTKALDGNETGETNSDTKATGEQKGEGYNLYSDTPQSGLGNFDETTYLTNATKTTSDVNNSSDSTIKANRTNKIDNTEDYIEHVTGRRSTTPAKLVKEFRDNLLNIDLMIIKDLGELFMTIY